MTQVASGSQASNAIFNAALFSENCKKPTFANFLTGSAPQSVNKKNGSQKQTDKGMPIVRVTNLEKEAGDSVTVDIFHELNGLPTMGDKEIEGRSEIITQAHDTIKIDQGRKPVDSGGKMTQKRTKHNLRKEARTLLGNYKGRLTDELTLCHLAGARGDFTTSKTILPADTHEEFAELLVNPILPPTFNRHSYGGDASSIDTLDGADLFSLDVIDELSLIQAESGSPIMPIKLAGDEMAEVEPMYLFYCTPRQWHDLNASTSGKDWQAMMARAMKRGTGFKHSIFMGDCLMRKNILVKPMTQTVRFNAGSNVSVSTDSANAVVETRQPGVIVERGMLIGAQALAHAYGNVGQEGKDKGHFSMIEQEIDAGNRKQQIIAWMDGMSKIRFKDKEGVLTDHGVHVVDTAVSTNNMF